jgi:hypothetical protein
MEVGKAQIGAVAPKKKTRLHRILNNVFVNKEINTSHNLYTTKKNIPF